MGDLRGDLKPASSPPGTREPAALAGGEEEGGGLPVHTPPSPRGERGRERERERWRHREEEEAEREGDRESNHYTEGGGVIIPIPTCPSLFIPFITACLLPPPRKKENN